MPLQASNQMASVLLKTVFELNEFRANSIRIRQTATKGEISDQYTVNQQNQLRS